MNILEKIKQKKAEEVKGLKRKKPVKMLVEQPLFQVAPNRLSDHLKQTGKPALIAEFKRRSPSKDWIRQDAHPVNQAKAFSEAGASAISCLTDAHFFGAQSDDFSRIRKSLSLPMLRKDFILDLYQVFETKAMGADMLLLIASMLHPDQIYKLSEAASSLGLDVMIEIHEEHEISYLNEFVTLAGINNRNLRTFEVDLNQAIKMRHLLPDHLPVIAESGISEAENVIRLRNAGFSGFLIGEALMKATDPAAACRRIVSALKDNE